MNSANLLNVGLVLVAVLLAGIAGLSRTRLSDLRSDNDDLRKSRDDMRFERDEERAENALQKAEIERSHSENETLRGIVTGEVKLEQIAELLAEHDRKAVQSWTAILQRLDKSKAE